MSVDVRYGSYLCVKHLFRHLSSISDIIREIFFINSGSVLFVCELSILCRQLKISSSGENFLFSHWCLFSLNLFYVFAERLLFNILRNLVEPPSRFQAGFFFIILIFTACLFSGCQEATQCRDFYQLQRNVVLLQSSNSEVFQTYFGIELPSQSMTFGAGWLPR